MSKGIIDLIDLNNLISMTHNGEYISITFWTIPNVSATQIQISYSRARQIMQGSGFKVGNRSKYDTIYSKLVHFLQQRRGKIYFNLHGGETKETKDEN